MPMITAVLVLAAATGSPQAFTDPCNHVAAPTSNVALPLPASLQSKYPYGVGVLVVVNVDQTGKVTDAGVWGAPPDGALVSAAQSAVMKSTFTPATVNCKAIADRVFTVVRFAAPGQ